MGIVCKGFETHPFYFYSTLYINIICLDVDAQYQNPPFLFLIHPYTQAPFLTVKPINPPFYLFSDLFKPTLFKVWVDIYDGENLYVPHILQKQTNPPFCRSCFSKINMMQIYTTPLNTTIFLTSKSYRGIKLV